MDGLEGNFTRPRQVRYQAALRPDIYCSSDFMLPAPCAAIHATRRRIVPTSRATPRSQSGNKSTYCNSR
jgi:hypothetical protein